MSFRMFHMSFELSLKTLTRQQIWETSPRSLVAFALVNRSCYYAAAPFIFQDFTIKFSSHEKLRRYMKQLTNSPLSQERFRYLRRLKLQSTISLGGSDSEKSSEHDESSDSEPDEESRSWKPIASFVSKLDRLSDLIYACYDRFPHCLLQVLHKHQPYCRLCLSNYRFLGLRDSIMDPHTLALIHSPCLHSLGVKATRNDTDGSRAAALRTVTVAPNLKHLNLNLWQAPSNPFESNSEVPKQPWKDFIPLVETSRLGSLTSFSLSGFNNPKGRSDRSGQSDGSVKTSDFNFTLF